MSRSTMVITIRLEQGDLDDTDWMLARRLMTRRGALIVGADGFLAATLPSDKRHEMRVSVEARGEV